MIHLSVGEDTSIHPLFFPCGSIKREVLPTALRENGKHLLLLLLMIKTQIHKIPAGVRLINEIITALPLSLWGFISLFPGIPLETLTVYQTAEHPDLEKNLRIYFTEQVKPKLVYF